MTVKLKSSRGNDVVYVNTEYIVNIRQVSMTEYRIYMIDSCNSTINISTKDAEKLVKLLEPVEL